MLRASWLVSCLLLSQLALAAIDLNHRVHYKGQCPTLVPLNRTGEALEFKGNWFQYAVHPNYLQDKCIRQRFDNHPMWQKFAYTDNKQFIVQYYCFEAKSACQARQHERSISIFVRSRQPTQSTIAAVTNALKRNFKFPLSLLNYTDYSFCSEIETQRAVFRA